MATPCLDGPEGHRQTQWNWSARPGRPGCASSFRIAIPVTLAESRGLTERVRTAVQVCGEFQGAPTVKTRASEERQPPSAVTLSGQTKRGRYSGQERCSTSGPALRLWSAESTSATTRCHGASFGMTNRSYLASGAALALALVLAAPGTADASTKKPKHKAASSFTVSGQVTGTLSFNKAESCQADNSSLARGLYTVRVYLTDQNVQPTKATWALVLEAKVGQTSYPAAYPDELALLAVSPTRAPLDTWSAGGSSTPSGSGSLTLAPKAKGGSLTNMVLSPSQADPGSASATVTITGKWSC